MKYCWIAGAFSLYRVMARLTNALGMTVCLCFLRQGLKRITRKSRAECKTRQKRAAEQSYFFDDVFACPALRIMSEKPARLP
jgi:hypothetical protein